MESAGLTSEMEDERRAKLSQRRLISACSIEKDESGGKDRRRYDKNLVDLDGWMVNSWPV